MTTPHPPPQINIMLLLAYDGKDFYGWQKTSTGPSIEETLEITLHQILQQKITLQAASRTDRGVHAEGQVVNFMLNKDDIDCSKLLRSLNSLLPKSIVIKAVMKKEPSFHPTLDCIAKEYHYYLSTQPFQMPHIRDTSWHVEHLNIKKMTEALPYFLGSHDFISFCNQRKDLCYPDTIRTLHSIILNPQSEDLLRIEIIGNHFLYKMVRIIVGTLVYIGKDKISISELSSIFHSKQRSRAGITAPAHGLFLKEIFYSQEL